MKKLITFIILITLLSCGGSKPKVSWDKEHNHIHYTVDDKFCIIRIDDVDNLVNYNRYLLYKDNIYTNVYSYESSHSNMKSLIKYLKWQYNKYNKKPFYGEKSSIIK